VLGTTIAEEGKVLPNGCWSRIVENLWLAGWLQEL